MAGGRGAVFDCFSGIAGDMCLAALTDLGADLTEVWERLEPLGLPPFRFRQERVTREGIEALHVTVEVEEERQYQPDEMREMVAAAGYPERVEQRALAALDVLAAGEAGAHKTDAPHFHEVGGVDAMVDIVGTMLALEQLDVAAAWCPVVTVGSGTIVRSSHGVIPAAPGPAAAAILQEAGFVLRFVEARHELVTPTGAAILTAVATPGAGTLSVTAHGAGAGTMDSPGRPNALRIFLGETAGEPALRELSLLEANIDDMPASLLAYARDLLLEEGAPDAWFEPIAMKKGRSATKLCALVPREREGYFAGLMMRETTTLGVRTSHVRRYEAERDVETVETAAFGAVRVKVSGWEGRVRRLPEFEDVQAIARERGLPALEVQRTLEAELNSGGG